MQKTALRDSFDPTAAPVPLLQATKKGKNQRKRTADIQAALKVLLM